MEAWATYLLKRRQYLLDQIRFLATGETRLEETTDGRRTDVTGDWLDTLQSEYAQISQILIEAGVLTEAQVDADAAR